MDGITDLDIDSKIVGRRPSFEDQVRKRLKMKLKLTSGFLKNFNIHFRDQIVRHYA